MEVLKCYEKVPCAKKSVLSCPKGILHTELFLSGNVLKSLETKYEDKNLQNVAAASAWWISLLHFCPLPMGEPLHLAPGGLGHAEHVDVASQYAECFASDLAGFSLQQRLGEKRQSSKSVLNNI